MIGLWFLGCATAVALLAIYSQTPGAGGAAVPVLVDDLAIAPDPDRPTLVMFVHPRCPCTRASVEELARLQRRLKGRFATRVVFAVPAGMAEHWHESTLWEQAAGLHDCERITDQGGAITQRAGAATSGTVGLYAPDGRLLFWGGITPSRGHAGDNLGSDAITDYFKGAAYADRADVYGCPLNGPGDAGCAVDANEHCKGVDE
jgi:hypothetical protein